MKEVLLHFDSIKSSNVNYVFNTSQNILNSGYTKYQVKDRIDNIRSIKLVTFEIPVLFPNIRTGSTSTFSFILNTVTYNLNLLESNYTTIDALILDLNAMILSYVALDLVTIVLTINSYNRVVITIKNVRPITFTIIDTNLSKYILGLSSTTTLLDSSTVSTTTVTTVRGISSTITMVPVLSSSSYYYMTGVCPYNLNVDNYISIYMPRLSQSSCQGNNTNITFKIPLNSIYNSIYYMNEYNSLKQEIDINVKNLILTELDVLLLDRFGNNLNLKNDYSFSLRIAYDA